MEYVNVDIGVGPSIIGHQTALGNVAPVNKPVYKSSNLKTENIQDLFIELTVGAGAIRTAVSAGTNTDYVGNTVSDVQITVWTLMGTEYKQFAIDTTAKFNNTYIINVGANASGTSILEKSAILAESSITPYIGSKTYVTVEPSVDVTKANSLDMWDWINGSDQVPVGDVGFGSGVGYTGYVEISSVKAFLVVNKDNNN